MEILALSLLFAIGKLIILIKFFPFPVVLYYQKWIDLFFAVVLPLLFLGTFSGAMTAAFSGFFLSVFLAVATLFVTPTPIRIWKKKRATSLK